MSPLELAGCTATPLSGYLKALAVFRTADQLAPETHASWFNGRFRLHTPLSARALSEHLLNDYRPTPVLAPWNGGSGFFDKDNKTAIDEIRQSGASRFQAYRDALRVADQVLRPFGTESSPKDDDKSHLLLALRAQLPEDALKWFDAAVLLAGDGPSYPPLLGTGGNDGRLDFTNNFMQRLTELFDAGTGAPTRVASSLLDLALFGTPAPGLVSRAIGQFAPGQVGGPNATAGYEADSLINPWDFVFMIEGALLFAASATRRCESGSHGSLSFPFTVRPFGSGTGQLTTADEALARAEMWVPVWERPMQFAELLALLKEGRVTLGRRLPRDGFEFARALRSLGVDRGLSGFERYAFLKRSGKAFLATPLGRVAIEAEAKPDLVDDLDHNDWLFRFHRVAKADDAPARLRGLAHWLDTGLFDLLTGGPRAPRVQKVLIALGAIQGALARSPKLRAKLGPVPRLGERWAIDANDGSHAFRIAAALASLSGEPNHPMPMRAHLWPVQTRENVWVRQQPDERSRQRDNDPTAGLRFTVPWGGDIVRAMIGVAERRLWLAEHPDLRFRDKPFRSRSSVSLADVAAFLEDPSEDSRIAALLSGLALCEIPHEVPDGASAFAPAGWTALKLVFTPDQMLIRLAGLPASTHVPVPPALLRRLAAGDTRRAVEIAVRRLRASGLPLALDRGAVPALPRALGARLAASLLLPLSFSSTGVLVRSLVKSTSNAPLVS